MKYKASLIVAVATSCLAITIAIAIRYDIPFGQLTRDPLAIVNADPYIGLLSNLGIILWSFTAAICFFSYYLIKDRNYTKDKKFLLYSGLFSLILLFDDFFLLHEKIIPYFLGLDEIFVLILYMVLFGYYLIQFKNIHFESKYYVLIIALGLFGISVIVDQFQDTISDELRYLLEDGSKYLGISFWTYYHVIICKQILIRNADI